MPQTLSVIKADIGGWVGSSAMHPEILAHGAEELAKVVQSGLLIDAQAHACADGLVLVMSHDRGEDNEVVHRFAWDVFTSGTAIAKRLGLYGAGRDLLADAFSGTIHGAGPGCAELLLVERPSEPVVVFTTNRTSSGAFNLPFYKIFADPLSTAGLVISEALHQGFAFEVHDLQEQTKVVLLAPDELYDLLLYIGSPSRFAVKRVVARATGEVGAVVSTDRPANSAGQYAGTDDPVAIVRCHGNFPGVDETIEPFTTAWVVSGAARGSHNGPWIPTPAAQAATSRPDGPPRVIALGFQLADGKLGLARDLFADPAFDNARAEANTVHDYLAKHGPTEPHRQPLDDMEYLAMPSVASKLQPRWTAI